MLLNEQYLALQQSWEQMGIPLLPHEPMWRHTSFKVGGAARLMVKPQTIKQLQQVLKDVKRNSLPVFVTGRGTNLLVNDHGINAVVVNLDGNLDEMYLEEETCIVCQAGASLKKLCLFAQSHGLTGLEFAYGIPGTVGGAVYMNAGAYGGEMKEAVASCQALDQDGALLDYTLEQIGFGYRTSVFQKNGQCIVAARFALKKGDPVEIMERMKEIMQRRKDKQPLEYPSAGSTFKRPQGNFAGALIEQCGLKGCCIGGAQVSEKHAGFVINKGQATQKDIVNLIVHIQKVVLKETGCQLECEVKII